MFGLSNEWVWVALIAALLFGAGNIPKLAKNFGEGIREFKKATDTSVEEKKEPVASGVSDVGEK